MENAPNARGYYGLYFQAHKMTKSSKNNFRTRKSSKYKSNSPELGPDYKATPYHIRVLEKII